MQGYPPNEVQVMRLVQLSATWVSSSAVHLLCLAPTWCCQVLGCFAEPERRKGRVWHLVRRLRTTTLDIVMGKSPDEQAMDWCYQLETKSERLSSCQVQSDRTSTTSFLKLLSWGLMPFRVGSGSLCPQPLYWPGVLRKENSLIELFLFEVCSFRHPCILFNQ